MRIFKLKYSGVFTFHLGSKQERQFIITEKALKLSNSSRDQGEGIQESTRMEQG